MMHSKDQEYLRELAESLRKARRLPGPSSTSSVEGSTHIEMTDELAEAIAVRLGMIVLRDEKGTQ